MNRAIPAKRVLTVLALCMGLIGATAGPAAADHDAPTKPGANRQTYTFDDCFTSEWDGDIYEYCYKSTETYKQVGTYAGKNFLYQAKFNSTSTFSLNGSEPEVYTSSGTYMFKAKEGVETIYKSKYQSNYGDCSYSSRYTVVQGELKKSIFDFVCTPS